MRFGIVLFALIFIFACAGARPGTQSSSERQSSTENRQAETDELYRAAHIDGSYWSRRAIKAGRKDGAEVWWVHAYNKPVRDSSGACVSTGTSWEAWKPLPSGAISMRSPRDQKLIYLGNGFIDADCAAIPIDEYSDVAVSVPTKDIMKDMRDLWATSQCQKMNADIKCNIWREVDASGSDLKYLSAVNSLHVHAAYLIDPDSLELNYVSSALTDGYALVLDIKSDGNGHKSLHIGVTQDETE